MSLDWNATAIREYDALKTDAEWVKTETLVWATMRVGLSSITEANATKFAARLFASNRLYGITSNVTLADIRRRVGLRTNATDWSDAKFRANLARILMDDAARQVAEQDRAEVSSSQ